MDGYELSEALDNLGDRLANQYATPAAAAVIAESVVDPKGGRIVDATLPVVVGVTGHAQNGKDTVGKQFVERGFTRFAFADPLREIALLLDPYVTNMGAPRGRIGDQAESLNGGFTKLSYLVKEEGWEVAKQWPEVRRFMQALGKSVRDVIGEDAWVQATAKRIVKTGAQYVVVTDVRYPNEADWIHGQGGKLIRVVRTTADGSEFDNGVGKEHDSEKYVETLRADAEFVVVDGQVDKLAQLADLAIKEVLFGRDYSRP
jgi:hypothetical protein